MRVRTLPLHDLLSSTTSADVVEQDLYFSIKTKNLKMVRLVSCALMISSAAAFVPSATQSTSSALNAKPAEKEIGVLPPMGFFE